MNTKTIFTTVAVALFAAVVLTGTVVGIQYVSAWHHAHRGHHGGYAWRLLDHKQHFFSLLTTMAKMEEHPERYGWWIDELESLGLSVNKINELNDLKEIRDLAEIIKQDKYIDYSTDYFNNGNPSQ